MSSYHNLYLETELSATAIKDRCNKKDDRISTQGIIDLLTAGKSGARSMKLTASFGAVKASGTFTFDTVIATDVITINGVDFTCVASGATGNQFDVGQDDTETAANAATAINASDTALIDGYVEASSSGAVLTITAALPGKLGNTITISSADTTVTESGARLESGSEGTQEEIELGLA